MQRNQSEHFEYIDGLRAVAVLAVIIYHLDTGILAGGGAGVDVFFVISGFVVSASLGRMPAASATEMFAQFYARRLRRILPALAVMLVTTQLLVTLFVPQVYLSRFIDDTAFAASLGYANIFLATHTDYFSPLAAFNPFVHTWSLGVEEQFYLIFPLLFIFLRRRIASRAGQSLFVGMICAASLVWGWHNTASVPGAAFYSSLSRFWEIGLGVLLQIELSRSASAVQAAPGTEIKSLTLVGMLGIVAAFLMGETGAFPVPGALLPVVATSCIIVGLHQRDVQSPWSRLLIQSPVRLVGSLSYSLYLWHWPVFVLANWTVGFVSPQQKVVALAIATAFSAGSYFFIERYFRYGRVFPRSMSALIAGAAAILAVAAFTSLMDRATGSLSMSTVVSQQDKWFPYDLLPDEEGCTGSKQESSLGGMAVTVVQNSCLRPVESQTLYVIGDSHAGAYTRMLDIVSRDTGFRIAIYETVGCGSLKLVRDGADCEAKTKAAVKAVSQLLRPGDIVFLPGLRIPRFIDEDTAKTADAQTIMSEWQTHLDDAVVRGHAFLMPLAARNNNIVFEMPKPVLKYEPYRCHDWFNAMNPACSLSGPVARAELEKLRAPVMEYASMLSKLVPGFTTWDPMATLCDATSCPAFAGDVPLYFDGDHISGAANEKLAGSFIELLKAR